MAYILLTGATGLVGRYLLANLLDAGARVAVVVRSGKRESALDRIESVMRHWERHTGRLLPRPVVFAGDLCQPQLGLSETGLSWIASQCDSIVHGAASMTFVEDNQGEPFRSNIEGTQNVLELCRRASIHQFHHVSTAFLCGLRQGRVLETEVDVGQALGNVYEKSKLEAEKLIRSATFLEKATFYRPSSVIGDSRSGYVTNYHGFYLPLQLAHAMCPMVPPREMGSRFFARLELNGSEGKNFVPVDWLAAAIVHLVLNQRHHGQTYHLASPQPVTVSMIQGVIQEAIERFSTRPLATHVEPGQLEEYEALFHQYMSIYRSHWRDDPTFDLANSRRALGHLPCPEVDREMLLRTARYAIENNFSQVRYDAIGAADTTCRNLDALVCAGERIPLAEQEQTVSLQINGPGGGQWHVRVSGGRVVDAAMGLGPAEFPAYFLGSPTFRRLIDKQLTVDQAISTGQLVVQGSNGSLPDLIRFLEEFLAHA